MGVGRSPSPRRLRFDSVLLLALREVLWLLAGAFFSALLLYYLHESWQPFQALLASLIGAVVIRRLIAAVFADLPGWLRFYFHLGVALLAVGAVGERQADAQGLAEWDNDSCLACHADPGPSMELPSGEILDLGIDEDRWNDSVHAFWQMQCVQCHSGAFHHFVAHTITWEACNFIFSHYRSLTF